MRNYLKITGCGLLALMTGLGTVSAQTPPEQIRDWDGLSYLGVVAGMEAWGLKGSDRLWMRAPDGRALIEGSLFSATGQDLGAALTGAPARTLSAPSPPANPTATNDPVPAPSENDPEAAQDASAEPTPLDWSAPNQALIGQALEITRSEAFWFGVGDPTAPEIWAWMDPSTPASQATFMMLRDRIAAGSVYLRVIPVVTRDPASAEAMAAILATEDPLRAFLARLDGGALPAAPEGEDLTLPEELVTPIERNGALATRIAPPALPFLVWTSGSGPVALAGVPGEDLFGDAVRVDPAPEAAPAPDTQGSDEGTEPVSEGAEDTSATE
jgi:hypothetical protein